MNLKNSILLLVFLQLAGAGWGKDFRIGVAKVDITPDYPVRLSGYASRTSEAEGVAQPIFARGLAISKGIGSPAVLITVDNCGITREIREEVVARLYDRVRLFSERITICSTHTHTAPALEGAIPNLFLGNITVEEQAHIRKYTRELVDKLEQVAVEALQARRPAFLYHGQGEVTFAANRRTPDGPVDHDAPVLVARGVAEDGESPGEVFAVVANYACHCTTLQDYNEIHGDWAGMAGHILEQFNPGAVALVTIGCGGDQNPSPRGRPVLAERYGAELAREAQWLIDTSLRELTGRFTVGAREVDLPFEQGFRKEVWLERAQRPGIEGYHAQRHLERMEHGVEIPEELPYLVQVWTFGEQLGMVFLPGEVVVDYALAFKKMFDRERLWVTAYANYVPCYIPSRRILEEGGYEAESSMWYYDQPGRLAPETEELIVNTVRRLVPRGFRAAASQKEDGGGGRRQGWRSILRYFEHKPVEQND